MNWTNEAFREVADPVSKESNVLNLLSRESFKSIENMNSTIGAQSANSVAAVAREFGELVLVDNDTTFVPGIGAIIGNPIASVAATAELIAATQEKENEQEESMKTNSNSGINDLIAVTQLKDSNANDQALDHAGSYDVGFTAMVRDDSSIWDTVYVGHTAESYSNQYSESTAESSPYFQSWSDLGATTTADFEIPVAARRNKIGSSFNWNKSDNYTKYDRVNPLAAKLWEGTSDDKLDNFTIQNLMSDYNQAESLASSVTKKSDDTRNSILGKI